MKPAPFAYDDPSTVDEAVALLAEHGDEAKVLAGGQSLVPLLNFRLARPDRLVDINRVGELAYLRRTQGGLRAGALTRTAALERSDLVAEGWPILREAARLVGHPQIRARGTVGGSVAHADPAAELPVALTALDARFHVRSADGVRTLEAADLFVTYLTTSLRPEELLTEIEVPALPPRTGSAFVEHARVHGDFALGGAAAVLSFSEAGSCERARLALLAAGSTPLRALEAEDVLLGTSAEPKAALEAARTAVRGLAPPGDAHAGSEYRRALIGELVRRAIITAATRGNPA